MILGFLTNELCSSAARWDILPYGSYCTSYQAKCAIFLYPCNRLAFLPFLRQHRTIPALRLKHRSGSCGTASALPKCSIMSGCGTRIVLRGQKPLALCDRCPCFGSLFPPLAALTFAASSIICAFGLASAAPRSPYRHLELCGIAIRIQNELLLHIDFVVAGGQLLHHGFVGGGFTPGGGT